MPMIFNFEYVVVIGISVFSFAIQQLFISYINEPVTSVQYPGTTPYESNMRIVSEFRHIIPGNTENPFTIDEILSVLEKRELVSGFTFTNPNQFVSKSPIYSNKLTYDENNVLNQLINSGDGIMQRLNIRVNDPDDILYQEVSSIDQTQERKLEQIHGQILFSIRDFDSFSEIPVNFKDGMLSIDDDFKGEDINLDYALFNYINDHVVMENVYKHLSSLKQLTRLFTDFDKWNINKVDIIMKRFCDSNAEKKDACYLKNPNIKMEFDGLRMDTLAMNNDNVRTRLFTTMQNIFRFNIKDDKYLKINPQACYQDYESHKYTIDLPCLAYIMENIIYSIEYKFKNFGENKNITDPMEFPNYLSVCSDIPNKYTFVLACCIRIRYIIYEYILQQRFPE